MFGKRRNLSAAEKTSFAAEIKRRFRKENAKVGQSSGGAGEDLASPATGTRLFSRISRFNL